jgi:hypothetical protein
MKTKHTFPSLLILAGAALSLALSSCATKPLAGPDPLDGPGEVPKTVAQHHAENIGEITGDKSRHLRP